VVGDEPLQSINWAGVRTWLREPEAGERVVATLLFTDIVRSTETAVRLGDAARREVLGRHNHVVRDQLDRFRGREVNTTGDGFLAIFGGAVRAVRAAVAIRDAAHTDGLEIRAGVHTGEVKLVGDDVRGLSVHKAARIAAVAAGGEVLVSSTTYQLASGGELAFEPRGRHELKGLGGARELYAVAV
jgi:class 3 adenylate cyclase